MAAIGSIRKHSTLLLIIVAVALLSFLVNPGSKLFQRDNTSEKFIVVGKEHLTHEFYMHAYNARKEQMKEQAERTLLPEEEFQINEQLYNMLIDSVLYAIQANNLGITVTNDELNDLVAGPHPHQYAAQFFNQGNGYDMRLAQQFLDNMEQFDSVARVRYMELEAYIEKEALSNKYLNLLAKAYYMPKAFARKVQEENSWKADLEIVQVPYSSPLISDDNITVDDKDLKKWYDANKYRFKQEKEQRVVDYVMFPIQPSEIDLIEIEKNVMDMYEEFTQTEEPKLFVNRMPSSRFDSTYFKMGELPMEIDSALFFAPVGTFVPPYIDRDNMWTFAKLLAAEMRPDSINISSFIIANYGMQNSPREKEESDKIVDTAYAMAMAGIDFHQVAQQYSDVQIPENPEQFSEWIEDASQFEFAQTLFDTLYKSSPGAIVKYELPNITYLFKINEKTAAQRKIQVAIGRKLIEASTETVENIESAANNFANGTDSYEKFSEAVIKHNLNKRTFDRVEKMTYALPGTNGNGCREIIKWIYDEKTNKGDVSQYALDNMFVVVVLKDIYPEGYKTLENEQVKSTAEMMAKRDKKLEMLEEMLKKTLSEQSSMTKIAAKYETEVDTATVSFADRNLSRFGPEGKMIGQIFAQRDAKTAVYKGEMGVYVVKINKFDMPTLDIESSNLSENMYIQQNARMYQDRILNPQNSTVTKSLKKLYKIEDNRYIVF